MIYEKLTYTNEHGESLEFGPNLMFGCNVSKDVTGISDIKNTIYSSSSMGQHGDTYVGERIEPRDIDIKGRIREENRDRQLQLRRRAQKILNPELKGKLTYTYGSFVRVIACYVDSSPVFTRKTQFQQFAVSLRCLDPFWRQQNESVNEIASWMGGWQFPTEIIYGDETSMQFGARSDSVIVDCYNDGDVSTGMRIKLAAQGTVVNPVLLNVDTQEYIKLNRTMESGDEIVINTSYGQKSAILTRQGTSESCYRDIDVDSTYIQLEIGDNLFRYNADSGLDNLTVTIYFSPAFLGV